MTRKMVCNVPTGEVFVKIMEKVVQTGWKAGSDVFWAVPVCFPALNKGKPVKKACGGSF
jgi:hypothetical protein